VQTFAALPLDYTTNAIAATAFRLRDTLATNLVAHHMGQIQWNTNLTQIGWVGLPFVYPSLQATQTLDGRFLLAGLFPPVPSTNPPPPELIAQVAGRTNLLYYDWEITQERLHQWRVMSQLYSIIDSVWRQANSTASNTAPVLPPLDPLTETNAPTQVWLTAIAPFLGNTITRAALTAPRELTVERKSPVSLTGFELMLLTRLLEAPAFLPSGKRMAEAPAKSLVPIPARPATPGP
jgi:hypothetical protein